MELGNIELRTFLHEITSGAERRSPQEHEELIAKIAYRIPHSIRPGQRRVCRDVRTWRFNCHAYTFGLTECEAFWQLQEVNDDAWPHSTFIESLLPTFQLVRGDAGGENVVLYRNESGQLKHSGIARGGLVHSKWGDGNTWAHGLYEVPISYGSIVDRFTRPSVAGILAAYLRFFEATGR